MLFLKLRLPPFERAPFEIFKISIYGGTGQTRGQGVIFFARNIKNIIFIADLGGQNICHKQNLWLYYESLCFFLLKNGIIYKN